MSRESSSSDHCPLHPIAYWLVITVILNYRQLSFLFSLSYILELTDPLHLRFNLMNIIYRVSVTMETISELCVAAKL